MSGGPGRDLLEPALRWPEAAVDRFTKEGMDVANELRVELVAVEERVYTGTATLVSARTTEGELGVLPGHAPLLGQLAEPGQVRIKGAEGGDLVYDVTGGFISVTGEGVTVLAESCTPASA